MARFRRRQFDRVSDYVSEQVAQLSRKYRRFRLVFLATFMLIAAANLAVAALAITIMAKIVQHHVFNDAAIVALTAAATSLVNLVLVGVNAALRYSYKKNVYANASKTLHHAYVTYVYGMGRYEENGLEVFKQDVQKIMHDVTRKRANWFYALIRRTVEMGE